MTWIQNYAPVHGSIAASAFVAVAPAVVLLVLLGLVRLQPHAAALTGLATALAAAIGIYGMPPTLAVAAAGYGAAYGLMPIGWIILNVLFFYEISVRTGQFDVIRRSVVAVTEDRRIQALLIAFGFGAFIEGAAGFGAPVAISTAMLVGLGFRPLLAALLCLVGNTAPVAYGALGTPIVALAQVTGLPVMKLSAMVGRQLPLFSVLIPFGLVAVMAGGRATLDVWPACLVAGVAFGSLQFAMSNFHGPWLVDTAAALGSIGAVLILLRFWRPKRVWRFKGESVNAGDSSPVPAAKLRRAWVPWLILTATVFVWALPSARSLLSAVCNFSVSVPFLDLAVMKSPPLVHELKPEPAVYRLDLFGATGTAPFVAALMTGFFLRVKVSELLRIYLDTVRRIGWSLLTITGMLAMAYVTRYAGLDSTLGLVLANTGAWFPFFSPILGWIGVVLTGSDTASNVLFGNLQQVTAHQLGVSPVLAAAANSTGGVMGKMIDAQSIVIAGVATGEKGKESEIFRRIFGISLVLAIFCGIVIWIQARIGFGTG